MKQAGKILLSNTREFRGLKNSARHEATFVFAFVFLFVLAVASLIFGSFLYAGIRST